MSLWLRVYGDWSEHPRMVPPWVADSRPGPRPDSYWREPVRSPRRTLRSLTAC